MKLHSETLDLSTRQPFGIARWTHSHYSRTFVSLEHEGLTGHGEAAPNAYYGETSGTVQAVLPELAMAVQDPWDWEGLSARMSSVLPHGHPSVRCALEMASLDWCARRVDLPVWRLLGLSDTCVPESSFTISLAPLDDMRSQTTEALNAGYTILKVKLGTAIIGISSIHLLKTFINADNYTDRVLIAQTVIHITFLMSAMAIAYTDKLMARAPGEH